MIQGLRSGDACLGVAVEQARHQVAGAGGDLRGPELVVQGDFVLHHRAKHVLDSRPAMRVSERQSPAEKLEQGDARAPQVRFWAVVAHHHLRGQVGGRAAAPRDHLALGEVRRQPKVRRLEGRLVVRGEEQEVVRFHVAVDDVLAVALRQHLQDGSHDLGGVRLAVLARADASPQLPAAAVLHHQVDVRLVLKHFVEVHHVEAGADVLHHPYLRHQLLQVGLRGLGLALVGGLLGDGLHGKLLARGLLGHLVDDAVRSRAQRHSHGGIRDVVHLMQVPAEAQILWVQHRLVPLEV
mmetsp:Transcript_14589/g.28042  ORF Transcript_14589/g.28042 Transcript_14589/m.28042 type:complete len:295 (-) Transcript_14589:288-1172(-)